MVSENDGAVIPYRQWVETFRTGDRVRSGLISLIWKRATCDLFHDDYKFVQVHFSGNDEIYCNKCRWRRQIQREKINGRVT